MFGKWDQRSSKAKKVITPTQDRFSSNWPVSTDQLRAGVGSKSYKILRTKAGDKSGQTWPMPGKE